MCDLPRRPRPRTYFAPIASQMFPRCAHRCAARSRHNLLPRRRSAAAAAQQNHPSGWDNRRRSRLGKMLLGRVRQGRVMQERVRQELPASERLLVRQELPASERLLVRQELPASERLLARPSAPFGQPLVSPPHPSVRTFPMPRALFPLGRTGPPASACRVSLRGFGP